MKPNLTVDTCCTNLLLFSQVAALAFASWQQMSPPSPGSHIILNRIFHQRQSQNKHKSRPTSRTGGGWVGGGEVGHNTTRS